MSSPDRKKRVRVVVVLVVLAVAAGVGWKLRSDALAAARAEHDLFHGNVDIRDVTLAFRVAGRVEAVDKREGDAVQPGEVVARLDAAPYRVALGQAQAAVQVAEAELARVVAGSRQEDIAQARAVVAERRANLGRARDNVERYTKLAETGAVTDQALTDAQRGAEQAKAALRASQAALRKAIEGARAEDVAVVHAQVMQARARMAAAELDLEETTLKASTGGTVVTRVVEPGAVVAPGSAALVVSFDDPVWIRAYASQPQLAHLAPGTQVEVLSDARPETPYRGQVGYVSLQAEFTPKNVETAELRTSLVYRFRVVVDSDDGGLRQGMPVTVRLADGGSDGTTDQGN